MSRDIAVIVKETPVHIVEVRTGIMGKRGPQGNIGPQGVPGPQGPQGERGRDIVIVTSNEAVININPTMHGDFYILTNDTTLTTNIVLNETFITNEDETISDIEGAAVFFTQVTDVPVQLLAINESVELILPKEKLPRAYGLGSTIGVVSRGQNKWVVFGDLAPAEVVT